MTEIQQLRYLEEINRWVNSKAYKQETREIIRTIYRDMANKSQNEIEFTAYRLSLMLLKKWDQRLLMLSSQHERMNKGIELNDLLD